MLDLHFSQAVLRARENAIPILALESTIISHGLPFPHNLEMVQQVEDIAREEGVTPATIAVLNGQVHIGLEAEELAEFAQTQNIAKLSRADLADCIARRGMGATTVAATMILAQHAGINVFATGGIGGVHQGAEESFDISADLGELARTNVIVICAGAKAILDLPKTYECLESLGVPVYGYGVDELPAFYSRKSGIRAPLRADHPGDIAKAEKMRRALNLVGGMVVANPIAVEDEIPANEIEPIIESALKQAQSEAIRAKDVTPFLLSKLFEASNGRTVEANITLVKNNVRLGAKIALELVNQGVK